jgi:predicted CoA-binding protein
MHDDLEYSDAFLRRILGQARTVAMVGASPKWVRPSHFAFRYLQLKGFQMIPVNPQCAGEEILGEKVYAALREIPGKVDVVDVFRSSEAAGPVADEAIAIGARVVWMQLGVRNDAAAERARAAGLEVVMNRCMKIEYGRLFGELGWCGVDTGIISSKRLRVPR